MRCHAGVLRQDDVLYAVDVAVHELIHALGYTAPLLNFFRQGTGIPMEVVGGRQMVLSESVREAVSEHFGCEMRGAWLEDDGGIGTRGSHWEQRFLGNELMTGTADGRRPLLSSITLALLRCV